MKLEICVDCMESAFAAVAGGADRIEVCGSLSVGGITPSDGFVEQCVALGGPAVMKMIRPHSGGFHYDADDLQMMVRDIEAAKNLGAQGVVFGVLQIDRNVDQEACKRLMDVARPLSVTFHRAFDLTANPYRALDSLLDLGIDRLLTSGQAASAMEGADLIRELVQRSGNGLTVMAGAGIRAQHISALVQSTGVVEIHSSASEVDSTQVLGLPGIVHSMRVTREAIVREMSFLCARLGRLCKKLPGSVVWQNSSDEPYCGDESSSLYHDRFLMDRARNANVNGR